MSREEVSARIEKIVADWWDGWADGAEIDPYDQNEWEGIVYEGFQLGIEFSRSAEGQSQTGSERENDAEKEDRRTNERQLD